MRRFSVPIALRLGIAGALALPGCGGGHGSGSPPADGGGDASHVADASTDSPAGQEGGGGDAQQGAPEAGADAEPDGAQGASEGGADAACVPSCVHQPCGTSDGCGGTCQFTPGDAGSSACVESAYFTVDYGDPLFDGVCASSSDRNSTSCSAGAVRYCRAKGFGTGFPEQTITTAVGILCVAAPATDIGSVPLSTLTGYISTCTSTNLYSIDCEAAADDYCASLNSPSYVAGFGPNEIGSGVVSVSCLPSSVATYFTVALSTFDANSCGESRNQNCDADAADYCTANGFAGGFGPLQASSPNMQAGVVCINQ